MLSRAYSGGQRLHDSGLPGRFSLTRRLVVLTLALTTAMSALPQAAQAEAQHQSPRPAQPQPRPATQISDAPDQQAQQAALINRITWGITATELARMQQLGAQRYLHAQLHPDARAALPAQVQQYIDALSITQESEEDAQARQRKLRQDARDLAPDAKLQMQRDARAISRQRADETAYRFIWRALYSPNQLQEQMTWFWMNHFNVFAGKGDIGTFLPQYEDKAIRAHALGKFRDMLRATIRSPAMLVYLDNTRNTAGHLNENYARELMELHTLGVNGGYTQGDVQELARILTGLGVRANDKPLKLKPGQREQLVEDGLFRFNPAQHDTGDKVFLGQKIRGGGMDEVDKAIDLLARHPATAHFISGELAAYFLGDAPPPALVDSMAKTFLAQDGDIAATLQTLYASPEFAKSLKTGVFKDPVHYVMSSFRLAYADLPPLRNPAAVAGFLRQMGQGLYQRQTPDGYPLAMSDWSGSGQMTQRFEIARLIVGAPQRFYRLPGDTEPVTPPRVSNLQAQFNAPDGQGFGTLSPATREALATAKRRVEANTFLLASPEFMRR